MFNIREACRYSPRLAEQYLYGFSLHLYTVVTTLLTANGFLTNVCYINMTIAYY